MQFRFISTIIFISLLSAELPIGFTEEEWNNRHLIQEMGHRTVNHTIGVLFGSLVSCDEYVLLLLCDSA